MELIEKLGIDWKLLVAQVINFFILLAVLYRFAYKPILGLLDKRAKTIEKGIRDAKESEEKLVEIDKIRAQRLAETQLEIGALFDKAKADAEAVKNALVSAAQNQADDLLRRSKLQIEEAKEHMLFEVKQEVAAFIVQSTGKLLEREFSAADQKRLADAIAKEIQS